MTLRLDKAAGMGGPHRARAEAPRNENRTGAARLYRNLGFEPHRGLITDEIEVDGGDRRW
jgi:hypothetical protein